MIEQEIEGEVDLIKARDLRKIMNLRIQHFCQNKIRLSQFFFTILIVTLLFSGLGCKNDCDFWRRKDECDGSDEIHIPESGDAELKVLFIGNSLTGTLLPQLVEDMAKSTNKNITVDSVIIYGTPFYEISKDARTSSKIAEGGWDYVFLQSSDISAFPDMFNIELESIEYVKSLIFEQSPMTKIAYMMVWGARDGVRVQEITGEFVSYSYEAYFEKIFWGTCYLANKTGVMVSPVGYAWNQVSRHRPELHAGLFGVDGFHPAYNGSYLAAAVTYNILFQEPIPCNFTGRLTPEEASYYQDMAKGAVSDHKDWWNLDMEVRETYFPQALNISANNSDDNSDEIPDYSDTSDYIRGFGILNLFLASGVGIISLRKAKQSKEY